LIQDGPLALLRPFRNAPGAGACATGNALLPESSMEKQHPRSQQPTHAAGTAFRQKPIICWLRLA